MGLTCRDLMVSPHVQKTVGPEESVATALNIIKASRARFLPVVDGDGKYIGVFTAPTLLKMILPKAATIDLFSESARMNLENLKFFNLSKEDFNAQIESLKDEKVVDNMSRPENVPVVAPDTPVMEGIFLIYKFKRHLVLVEPDTEKFIGTVSPNSLLDQVLS